MGGEYDAKMTLRFWRKVDKHGPVVVPALGCCWVWIGARGGCGYGKITKTENGKQTFIGAHRYSLELAIGPLSDGIQACHRCDNPPCVNPSHLFPGTKSDNVRDALIKGRLKVRRGEHHPCAKISKSQAREIKEMRTSGKLLREIAPKFGLTLSSVCAISKGRIWKESSRG